MLKRLAAIIFILAIAGNLSAAVCGCLDGDKTVHSCCKKNSGDGASLRAKGCCDTNCVMSHSQNSPQDRTETIKISFKTAIAASPEPIVRASLAPVDNFSLPAPFTNHRLKYSRPPELYLRHHAFLI
jgi:hypothetical protein